MIDIREKIMNKLLEPFRLFQNFMMKLYRSMFLQKHKFNKGDLIYRSGTRSLYEVDENYYNLNFEPVTIVRAYPVGTQLLGIDRHEILEFKEYRQKLSEGYNTTASDVGSSAHDNLNFAKGVKAKK
jgi:hypothetical protein